MIFLVFLLVAALVVVVGRRVASPWTAVGIELRGPPPTSSPPPAAIRVGAYNIAHGRGATDDNFAGGDAAVRAARLDAIAAFIRAKDLDVVVLNEVDFSSIWSGNVDQAAVIADAAGYPFVVRQKNLDVGLGPIGLSFGNAVLSRWPITDASLLRWPAKSRLESIVAGQKMGATVTVDVGGTALRIVPVHLEHRDEATRLLSASMLSAIAADGGPPLMALGDFNSGPRGWPLTEPTDGTTAVQRLLDAGFRTAVDVEGAPAGLSFPAWAPNRRLDWVMVTSPLEVIDDVVGGDVVGLVGAALAPLSDHVAVWATVRVP
jgi:endonuclease/exonuclease/phosphatase family metal-dependent hydrolase